MTFRGLLLAVLSSVSVAVCQSNVPPELKVRILVDKRSFAINEDLVIRAQLTNTTEDTLCFPKPATNVQSAVTGWIQINAEPTRGSDRDQFLEVFDGEGESGKELEAAIKNDWIKLKPGESFTTGTYEMPVRLDQPGDWRLSASYRAPERLVRT